MFAARFACLCVLRKVNGLQMTLRMVVGERGVIFFVVVFFFPFLLEADMIG